MTLPNRAAERPIVRSARAAQFFHRKFLVAGIEQYAIDMLRLLFGLLNRFWPGDVDDLHHGNPGQRILKLAMSTFNDVIANLNRIRPAEPLLLDDGADTLSRSQQERTDARRDAGGNLRDEFIANHARPTRHKRNQSQRGCSTIDG